MRLRATRISSWISCRPRRGPVCLVEAPPRPRAPPHLCQCRCASPARDVTRLVRAHRGGGAGARRPPAKRGAPLWEQHPERATSSSAALEMLNYNGTSERNRNTRKNDYLLCISEILVAIAKHNGCDLADVPKLTLSKARHAHFLKQAQAMRKEREERRGAEAKVALTPAGRPASFTQHRPRLPKAPSKNSPKMRSGAGSGCLLRTNCESRGERDPRPAREGLARRTGNGDGDGDDDDDKGCADDLDGGGGGGGAGGCSQRAVVF